MMKFDDELLLIENLAISTRLLIDVLPYTDILVDVDESLKLIEYLAQTMRNNAHISTEDFKEIHEVTKSNHNQAVQLKSNFKPKMR